VKFFVTVGYLVLQKKSSMKMVF